MGPDNNLIEDLPLARVVHRKVCQLLDDLGSHRIPDLYKRVLAEVEKVLIEEALQRSAGMKNQAAEILGVHRNTLRNRMRVLKITARRGS